VLDNIAINLYPDRIAAIEIHTRQWMDTLCYNAEAYQRWLTFPGDANPSRLYIDGHRDPSYYYTWQDSIVNRMNKPATVTIRMLGSFNPGNGSGSVTGIYRNDSNATITGRLMFVIVEDSVYYMDSLGGQAKEWHNHTPRDYIPGPLGTIFTIAAGDSVIYTQPFTISLPVRYEYCSIITYIQDTTLGPDLVTRKIYQGSMIKVSQMVGIAEGERSNIAIANVCVRIAANPCRHYVEFEIRLPASGEYAIDIFDAAGRLVNTVEGIASAGEEKSAIWDGCDRPMKRVKPGIYFYRFKCAGYIARGKIIIL